VLKKGTALRVKMLVESLTLAGELVLNLGRIFQAYRN
jgi:hypothetical protein